MLSHGTTLEYLVVAFFDLMKWLMKSSFNAKVIILTMVEKFRCLLLSYHCSIKLCVFWQHVNCVYIFILFLLFFVDNQ